MAAENKNTGALSKATDLNMFFPSQVGLMLASYKRIELFFFFTHIRFWPVALIDDGSKR